MKEDKKICVTFTSGQLPNSKSKWEVSCGEERQRKNIEREVFPSHVSHCTHTRELAAFEGKQGVCTNIIMQIYDHCIDIRKTFPPFNSLIYYFRV